MPDFIQVFISGFLSVFLLGFQSRLVNHGNFVWAACCSFTIAFFQASLWHNIMKEASLINTFAYGISGACAITSAMYIHKRIFLKEKRYNDT